MTVATKNTESMGHHSPSIEIYTDGACEPNPGPGGYGAVLLHPKKRMEISGGFRLTTNNRMEMLAAIKGLELLKQPCRVVLYSDSKYLVDAMTEGWPERWKKKGWWRTRSERAANVDLWERLLSLCAVHRVDFRWVKGHAGIVENERCDALSMAALAPADLPVDEGFENKPSEPSADMQEGEPCRKCGGAPEVKQFSRSKPKHDYYYEFYLWCPMCNANFTVESAKRMIEQPSSLF